MSIKAYKSPDFVQRGVAPLVMRDIMEDYKKGAYLNPELIPQVLEQVTNETHRYYSKYIIDKDAPPTGNIKDPTSLVKPPSPFPYSVPSTGNGQEVKPLTP